MSYTTLISTAELERHLGDPDWAIMDCRFSLTDTAAGHRHYLTAHIPGAVYTHLDEDLSGPIRPGVTGRHPLPALDVFVANASRWGIDGGVQVVAYDDMGGAIAGRLWWMLRWMGHDQVAVLDGDWRAWQREGRPISEAHEERTPRSFASQPCLGMQASADDVLANLHDPVGKLFDARGADRYRGENETLDAKGGHIPGADSVPFMNNLTIDGFFLPAATLRKQYETLLGGMPADRSIFYCGSGVTAAHDLLALAHAGLGDARLYAGSWSEWITDPARPIASGPHPHP